MRTNAITSRSTTPAGASPEPIPTPEEFAANLKPTPKCHICKAPYRADVERAYANGVSYANLTRWIAQYHGRLGDGTVRGHFANRHHEHNANS